MKLSRRECVRGALAVALSVSVPMLGERILPPLYFWLGAVAESIR